MDAYEIAKGIIDWNMSHFTPVLLHRECKFERTLNVLGFISVIKISPCDNEL